MLLNLKEEALFWINFWISLTITSRKRHCFGNCGFALVFQQLFYIYIYIYIPIYDLKCQTVIMIVVIRKEYNMDQIIGFHFSQPKESVSHFYGRS